MSRAFIYNSLRTVRGKAKADGGLADHSPQDLVKALIDGLEERGSPARASDGLILGCVGQIGDQGGHIALISKLHGGVRDEAFANTVNNFCVSGLTAIGHAAASVANGGSRSVLAGGVEMMSRVGFMADQATYYTDPNPPKRWRYIPVVLAADRLAGDEGITREQMDAVALMSQQRSAMAEHSSSLLASRMSIGALSTEECVRPQTTADALAAMEPAFAGLADTYAPALDAPVQSRLTMAHAPPVADGAGLALIARKDPGIGAPRARILAYAESGGDPRASLLAGFTAMDRALKSAGLTLKQMDAIEFMEAFAVTIAKFLRDRDVDPDRVNIGGGHLSKGHPMGATGAILLSSLLDALDTVEGTLGLVVATGASGVGAAMIVERINSGQPHLT